MSNSFFYKSSCTIYYSYFLHSPVTIILFLLTVGFLLITTTYFHVDADLNSHKGRRKPIEKGTQRIIFLLSLFFYSLFFSIRSIFCLTLHRKLSESGPSYYNFGCSTTRGNQIAIPSSNLECGCRHIPILLIICMQLVIIIIIHIGFSTSNIEMVFATP